MGTLLNPGWSLSQQSQRMGLPSSFNFRSSLTSCEHCRGPKAFKCTIKPRSEEAAELIKQAAIDAEYIGL